MNTKALFFPFLICGSLLLAAPLSAQENDDSDLGSFIEPPKWNEGEVVIPAFPNRRDLIKIELDRADQPFNFYLDPKALSSGKDSVVRYTLVLESYSGARNVFYEGIRCQTGEYRTYAYGRTDGKFSKATIAKWTSFHESDRMAFRYNFFKHYMCDGLQNVLPRDRILQRIRYPENFREADEYGIDE